MDFLKFRNAFKNFTTFSLQEIRNYDPRFHRRRLSEWQDREYIINLRRCHYIFSDLEVNESVLFEIANRIYSPSYVSFEMALSYHNLIPESVYGITCASTLKTSTFRTPLGDFIYRTVKPELFFGYEIIKYDGKSFKIARAEKALLDFLYIKPHLGRREDFEDLRMNREEWLQSVDHTRLERYAKKFTSRRLARRLCDFERFLKNA